MSTNGVIGFEDHDKVIYLYSDGYPSFVIPLVTHSYPDIKDTDGPWAEELIDAIMANLEREADEAASRWKYKSRGADASVGPKPKDLRGNYSIKYDYLVLKDGRIISGIDIFDLKESVTT